MSAADVVTQCREAGVKLALHDDRLSYEGPDAALAEMLPLVKVNKAGIVALLRAANDPIDAAMAEDLDERAAIIGEDADTAEQWAAAQVSAIRLVQCRRCVHFTPDTLNTADGIGTCALKAWPQSRVDRGRPLPPYPNAGRYCEQFEVRP